MDNTKVSSREIAGYLYSLADILESEAKRISGLYRGSNHDFPDFLKEAEEVRDLANRLHEAKIAIEC